MNAKSLRRVALGAGLVLSAVGPAVAHHSFAMFDCSKTVTTNGSVRMFHWPVPHVYI